MSGNQQQLPEKIYKTRVFSFQDCHQFLRISRLAHIVHPQDAHPPAGEQGRGHGRSRVGLTYREAELYIEDRRARLADEHRAVVLLKGLDLGEDGRDVRKCDLPKPAASRFTAARTWSRESRQ